MAKTPRRPKHIETLTHDEAARRNIPTAEYQSVMRTEEQNPIRVAYERRNRDLDPQLVWRGKDAQDQSDLIVQAPPLYIQEKVHPKALIDDLRRRSRSGEEADQAQPDLFENFNGLPDDNARTEFYQHDANWSNRMILGDSLQVMASLAEREGLRGKVQCIYLDPPYGIKFNSNFQWSTTSRDVKDGKAEHITREPEQVKAFRDTWRDGIHSYLTYLRDRLTVARELLTESGSIFVQIGDENVHRVRALMDEVFGDENFVSQIFFKKTNPLGSSTIGNVGDSIVWYAKNRREIKFRKCLTIKKVGLDGVTGYSWIEYEDGSRQRLRKIDWDRIDAILEKGRLFAPTKLTAAGLTPSCVYEFEYEGIIHTPKIGSSWRTNSEGMSRVIKAKKLIATDKNIYQAAYFDDNPSSELTNIWADTRGEMGSVYVVQTSAEVVKRCLLMTTDPGDLVLDPTCGSGTTAYVAEQWGRRWITIDTSRVALALARARVMGARYPYYLLADSPEGQRKEAEITRKAASQAPTYGNVRHGFVYERVPHITLKSIANNAEIDVIHERMQPAVEAALAELNEALATYPEPFPVTTGGRAGQSIDFTAAGEVPMPSGEPAPANGFLEWEVPRDPGTPWPREQQRLHTAARAHGDTATAAERRRAERALADLNALRGKVWTFGTLPEKPLVPWPSPAEDALRRFREARIARQREIDASIAAKADYEYLYDKPCEARDRVRVAGPFTVESLSPHRVLTVDENDELVDGVAEARARYGRGQDFADIILENLRTAGVQQAHKTDRIAFTSLTPWPGRLICAEGRYLEGAAGADDPTSGTEKRAGVFIGPEFGTVSRPDLVASTREAADAGFDVLIACAFNYDAHSSEFDRLGRLPVLKARMNADLHMADDLKNTGKGNLFVIFGEPDIDVLDTGNGEIRVKVNGVDIFHPQTGEIRSDEPDGIACWFIDTDYDEESFFVRHAYFLGANDPYKALKTTLRAEIDPDAWASLHSDTSQPFPRPKSGRIAVKVINHLGDEVMKVFRA